MYDPLDRSASQVRLLRLLPGSESEDVVCKLLTVSLDESNDYEALSYVWGTAMCPQPITLNGELKDVTENLESALRHLRDNTQERILWIDALCINQEDLDERTSQVQLMHRVYSDASQVVVWLGPKDGGMEDTLEMITKIGSDPELHWTTFPMKEGSTLLKLWAVMNAQWWWRIWTVQEAVLAKQMTYQRGRTHIPGQTLTNLAKSYMNHLHNRGCCSVLRQPETYKSYIQITGNLKSVMDNILQIHRLQQTSPISKFDEIASLFRARIATKAVDKVYGLLGISCGITESSVNYNLGKIDAFELATRDCIAYNKDLNILSHVIHHDTADKGDLSNWEVHWRRHEPSWVPDWTDGDVRPGNDVELMRYRTAFSQHYSACGTLEYQPLPSYPVGRLRINGICCDVIETISDSVLSRMDSSTTEHIYSWRSMSGIDEDPNKAYPGGDAVSEAFWRTLCLDIHVTATTGDDGVLVRRADADDRAMHLTYWYIKSTHFDQKLLQDGDLEFTKRFMEFSEHILKAVARRKFFISQKGYMGFAPLGTMTGDRICVLAGGKVPLIVRADPDHEGEPSHRFGCRLLGDAYVHGLMDGEAMKSVDEGVLKVEDFELI